MMSEQRERFEVMTVARKGRDARGRFTVGNAGGPGRPHRAHEVRLLARLSSAVTDEAWDAIISTAIAQAISGDDRARRWLAEMLIGRPKAASELTLDAQIDSLWVQHGIAMSNEGEVVNQAEESDNA